MMQASAHELIPIAVERTIDSLVGGLLLAGGAWTWLRVARRQNSASRFIFLFILLVGIAVLPIAGVCWLRSGEGSLAGHSLITLPNHAAEYIFGIWALIAAVALARIATACVQLARLRRSCQVVDATDIDSRVIEALESSPRLAVLCTSERVGVPTALGLGIPAKIVIPNWLMGQLSPDELHHLVLHELAHLRRWDDWTNLAQRVMGAVLFFHPAVWWLNRRLALEREMACDECVLAETGNAKAYARSLATMAERSFVRRTVALAQAAVSRLHDTTLRVSNILALAKSPPRKSRMPLLASAGTVAVLTAAVAVFIPDLVSFTEPAAAVAQSSQSRSTMTAAVEKSRVVTPVIMASLPISKRVAQVVPEKAPKIRSRRPLSARASESLVARATPEQQQLYIPARVMAEQQASMSNPAMLVVWQETYDNGDGFVVQRTFWRVVVLNHPITPKEQPQKSI